MTAKTSKPSSNPVATPLHLLQGLTRTLNEHLAEACNRAEEDAQAVLNKLTQKQTKVREKQAQTQTRLAEAEAADDTKAKDKLTLKLHEQSEQLTALEQACSEAERYAQQLNSDVRQTLRLAKGLERIELQAGQAIEKRNNPAPATNKRPATRRSRPRKPAAAQAAQTESSEG